MNKKIFGILIVIFLITTLFPGLSNGLKCKLPNFDIGVGEPSNIHNGDYRSLGDDSLYVTLQNYGDLLVSVELNFTLERLDGLSPIEILNESFESLAFPPENWFIHHDGNQHQWQHDTIIGHESSSSAGLFTIWPPTPPMIFNEWLVTENYDLSNAESLTLSFWYYGNSESGVFNSNLEIWASIDGGIHSEDFLDTGILLYEIEPLPDEVWMREHMDLSPVLGEENVHFAFRFIGEELDFIEFFIDHILIEGDGYDWDEIDTSSNGPYDLDPEAYIESFFDVFYDFEGEYRATFSLDSPLRGNWSDDNPDNDVYQAVFNVIENNPPNEPSISYDKVEDELSITAIDPDGNKIRYGIDWDNDCNVDQWTELVDSGTEQKIDCEGRKGTVDVISEDEYGAQSEWVSVTSKSKTYYFSLLERFFQRFHFFERILSQIML